DERAGAGVVGARDGARDAADRGEVVEIEALAGVGEQAPAADRGIGVVEGDAHAAAVDQAVAEGVELAPGLEGPAVPDLLVVDAGLRRELAAAAVDDLVREHVRRQARRLPAPGLRPGIAGADDLGRRVEEAVLVADENA